MPCRECAVRETVESRRLARRVGNELLRAVGTKK
jgi:hypothetical protein